jgi:hypothetical protein
MSWSVDLKAEREAKHGHRSVVALQATIGNNSPRSVQQQPLATFDSSLSQQPHDRMKRKPLPMLVCGGTASNKRHRGNNKRHCFRSLPTASSRQSTIVNSS